VATFYKPKCKCPKDKRCNCGATWSYITDTGMDPKTGKRKQKKKGGFRTRGEAVTAEAILRSELAKGTYIEEKNITFEKFAEQWLQIYQANGKIKISTVRIRNHEIAKLSEHFAKLKIKDITRSQYQDMLNKLKGADSTRDGVHFTGRMIFRKAIELEVIKTDPTVYAAVPKVTKTIEQLEELEIPEYLEKEELALFLRTAQDCGLDRDYEIFLTLAYTGLRVGELCALKWTDIDEVNQTIRITKTYYNPTNNIRKYTLLPPKTKSSKRIIDVDPIVLDALKDLKTRQKEIKIQYQTTYYDKKIVFAQTGKDNPGYPAYIKLIENRMDRLLKLAKLNTDLTPHSLRHTHCSLLAEVEVSLEQVMQRLGHSDDTVTKRVYLHVTKPRKKEASQKFAQLLRGL